MTLTATVDALEIFRVVVPLPEALRVWGQPITQREFVFVRAHAGGQVGTGFALTRGMEIDRAVERHIKPEELR